MARSNAGQVALLTAGALLAACASDCGASADKLAQLRRGMTYQEATSVMGCEGKQASLAAPDSGSLATVEWDGPEFHLSRRTQLDFLDGRLLSFTTGQRWP